MNQCPRIDQLLSLARRICTLRLPRAKATSILLLAPALLALPACAELGPDRADFHLSPQAAPPRWERLDPFQESLTAAEFRSALTRIYSVGDAWKATIAIHPTHAEIRRSGKHPEWPPYRLNFAPTPASRQQPATAAYWRPAQAIPPAPSPASALSGLHIAIDPGHLGGHWAKIEERWFQIGDTPPVEEGRMTLAVAELLAPKLR
ncbi:MAG: hypothetical protein ACC661_10915, partial [Verrucomicrobiales bacterium]